MSNLQHERITVLAQDLRLTALGDLYGGIAQSAANKKDTSYADFLEEVTRNPQVFDASYTRWGTIQWMPPETLLTLGEHLSGRGWSTADIHSVLGGNFYRVALQAWRR